MMRAEPTDKGSAFLNSVPGATSLLYHVKMTWPETIIFEPESRPSPEASIAHGFLSLQDL